MLSFSLYFDQYFHFFSGGGGGGGGGGMGQHEFDLVLVICGWEPYETKR